MRKSPKKIIFRSAMRRDSLTGQEYKSPGRKIIYSKLAQINLDIPSTKTTLTTDVSDNVSENNQTE